jgi:hypothetical protein
MHPQIVNPHSYTQSIPKYDQWEFQDQWKYDEVQSFGPYELWGYSNILSSHNTLKYILWPYRAYYIIQYQYCGQVHPKMKVLYHIIGHIFWVYYEIWYMNGP